MKCDHGFDHCGMCHDKSGRLMNGSGITYNKTLGAFVSNQERAEQKVAAAVRRSEERFNKMDADDVNSVVLSEYKAQAIADALRKGDVALAGRVFMDGVLESFIEDELSTFDDDDQ